MTFADLSDGATIFLDANIFVYHFAQHPTFGAACTALLDRIERQELDGFTSTHVLSETAHRLMTLEACTAFSWPYAGVANRLKRQPQELQKLTRFRQAIEFIVASRIHLLTISGDRIVVATALSQQTGLLSNDALIVAIMQHQELANLASCDADFDRISELTRFAPT